MAKTAKKAVPKKAAVKKGRTALTPQQKAAITRQATRRNKEQEKRDAQLKTLNPVRSVSQLLSIEIPPPEVDAAVVAFGWDSTKGEYVRMDRIGEFLQRGMPLSTGDTVTKPMVAESGLKSAPKKTLQAPMELLGELAAVLNSQNEAHDLFNGVLRRLSGEPSKDLIPEIKPGDTLIETLELILQAAREHRNVTTLQVDILRELL